jgi:protease I
MISLRTFLIFPLFISLAFFSGCTQGPIKEKRTEEKQTREEIVMPQESSGQKVAMIVSFEDFRDEEYFIPKEILERAGFEVVTVSNALGLAHGVAGGEAQVDVLLSQLRNEDYQAIVFIGGPGALENLDNPDAYRIIQTAVQTNQVLAAICISPVILAKAGVLQGKEATVWSSYLDKRPVKILQENGAVYQDDEVVIAGKIITANGPEAAEEFGQAIVQALTL